MRNLKQIQLQRFVKHADPEAFSEIVRLHAGLVYGACLRILGDEDKAADAAQETFFQMLKNAGQITGSVSGWLHRVATCKAIDRIRKDSAQKRHETNYSIDNPLQVERWTEISQYVDEELDNLDPQMKEVLVRHYFMGQTTRQIGKEIGISQATVSRRLESGLDLLRVRLGKKGFLITVAALGGLLGQNAAQAVPSAVMTELGKMALVAGTTGAAASGAATASAAESVTGGVLAGVKAKMIAAAVVAAVGTGTVITYNQLSQPPQPEPATVQSISDRPVPRTNVLSRNISASGSGSNITYVEGPLDPMTDEPTGESARDDEEFNAWFESLMAEEVPAEGTPQTSAETAAPSGGMGGGMGGGMMGGMGSPMRGGFGGMMMGGTRMESPQENPGETETEKEEP
jgi:RNA polymerase sigma-70 factor (ECF subfamily)